LINLEYEGQDTGKEELFFSHYTFLVFFFAAKVFVLANAQKTAFLVTFGISKGQLLKRKILRFL
jgi:hypothetical protein